MWQAHYTDRLDVRKTAEQIVRQAQFFGRLGRELLKGARRTELYQMIRSHPDQFSLFSRNGIPSYERYRKLMRISRHPRLTDPATWEKLPDSLEAIYQLSFLEPDELDRILGVEINKDTPPHLVRSLCRRLRMKSVENPHNIWAPCLQHIENPDGTFTVTEGRFLLRPADNRTRFRKTFKPPK